MSEKIKLVQNDTRPSLLVTLTDETTESAIDITGASVVLKFRAVGASELTEEIAGVVLDGPEGYCRFDWTVTALATAGEYEGEIEITFQDGTIQTVYEVLKFKVRAEIG